MKKLTQFIRRSFDKEIDGTGLAIFRICFSAVMLFEVLELFYFRHLIFDKVPYVVPSDNDMWPVFLFWIISLLFIIFGFFTRVAAFINYLFTVAVMGTLSSYEYHMFYTYLIISVLFIFLPVSRTMSLDRLLLKLKYSNTKFRYNPPKTVPVIAYYLPILFGIAFVYFDSVFFKLTSSLWLNGMGLWQPSSTPLAIFMNLSPILNIKYLAIGLGYVTLIFETLLLFVFWRKKWRVPMLVIGIGFHLGILMAYPIPFFALGISTIYLLMIPVSFWKRIFGRKVDSKKRLKFYYDGECPLCNRTRVAINHFDSRNRIEFLTVQGNTENEPALNGIAYEILLDDIHSVNNKGEVHVGLDTYIQVFGCIWYLKPLPWILRIPGIYYLGRKVYKYVAINRSTERCTEDNCGYVVPELPADDSKLKILTNFTLKDLKIAGTTLAIVILLFFQLCSSYNAPLLKQAREKLGIEHNKVIKATEKVAHGFTSVSKPLLGITSHGLFMERHFIGYNHIIGVIYKKDGKTIWLPIFDSDGTPGDYLFGPTWAKWTFRVNNPQIDQVKLENGVRDFTAFWASKNGINLNDATFEIMVKKIDSPNGWQYDYLNNQIAKPWVTGGHVEWHNKEFTSHIADIEKL